jgi:hypothetical protein
VRGRFVAAAVQVAVAGLVVYFIADFAAGNWSELARSGESLSLDLPPLAAAAALVLGTYALLISAWRAVMLGWGERLGWSAAARIWCLSNLARYLPGRIWQIAGMAALSQRAGVSPWAAAGSAVVVQLLAIATGALVTVSFAPGFDHPLLVGAAGAATAAGAAALAFPAPTQLLARALTRVTGRSVDLRPVRPWPLLASALITCVAWAAYGLALVLCADGLVNAGSLNTGEAIGVFTGSYVAGLINVFTPGGLGTREVILVTFLAGPLGPAAASVVTVGSRLLMTATEVLAALVTLTLEGESADAG